MDLQCIFGQYSIYILGNNDYLLGNKKVAHQIGCIIIFHSLHFYFSYSKSKYLWVILIDAMYTSNILIEKNKEKHTRLFTNKTFLKEILMIHPFQKGFKSIHSSHP